MKDMQVRERLKRQSTENLSCYPDNAGKAESLEWLHSELLAASGLFLALVGTKRRDPPALQGSTVLVTSQRGRAKEVSPAATTGTALGIGLNRGDGLRFSKVQH